MIKAALIGCGARGRSHAVGFQGSQKAKLTCLSDLRMEACQALNDEFSLSASLYTDHREMLAKEKPEMACIVLWPGLHLPVFRDCVEAGVKAVLCEKPMAPTWEDCQEMSRLAEESGVILAFSHQRRYAKGCIAARRLIKEGVIGKPLHLHLFSPPNILDCGTHTLDQAMSFLGEKSGKWVLGAVDASQPISWFGVEADYVAAGQIVFEDGIRATIQCGGPDMDIWGGVRITGEDGFLEVYWDGQISRAVVYKDPSWTLPPIEEDTPDDHMTAYIDDVSHCLLSGGEPETSHTKALRAAEIIYGFLLSAKQRVRLELPLTGPVGNPFHQMLASGELNPARAIGEERALALAAAQAQEESK
jgi:UDP-N-acetyl-2-amino-2-deoxyglucuronate dehydrogenase